jgi:hypothetical protein
VTDLAPIRTEYMSEDRRWLRDIHGLTDTYGLTLVGDLFPTAAFPDGTVKSGTVVVQVSAAGANQRLYGPFDPAAADGRQTPESGRAFLLLDSHKVSAGRRTSVAGIDHGAVLRNFLPAQVSAAGRLTAAVEAAMPRVRFTNG